MKYLHEILSLFLFPVRLICIFIIKPIAQFVLKDELLILKKDKDDLIEKNKIMEEESFENFLQIESYKKQLVRFNTIYNKLKDNIHEITFTKKNEMVIISYARNVENHFDIYKLYGFNGVNIVDRPDSIIYLAFSFDKDTLKIQDFMSNEKQRGYGRVLLNFIIERVKENNIIKEKANEKTIKLIYGDLSSTDEFEFEWLLPFYKSLGFEIFLFEDKSEQMLGKIKLDLTR